MSRSLRQLILLAAVPVAGCSAIPGFGGGGVAGPDPPFAECTQDEYAFVGETSLAAIGLDLGGGPDDERIGQIWVTADPVDPAVWGAPPGPGAPLGRAVCIEFADGSGMSTTIPDDWQPPGAGFEVGGGGNPLVILAGLLTFAILAVASWLVFRQHDPQPE
jgi:hypothetical protein